MAFGVGDREEWSEGLECYASIVDNEKKGNISKQLPEEILDILDNLMYWETCPDKYKKIIKKYLPKGE